MLTPNEALSRAPCCPGLQGSLRGILRAVKTKETGWQPHQGVAALRVACQHPGEEGAVVPGGQDRHCQKKGGGCCFFGAGHRLSHSAQQGCTLG